MNLYGVSICFINAHLTPFEKKNRINQYKKILENINFEGPSNKVFDHEYDFFK